MIKQAAIRYIGRDYDKAELEKLLNGSEQPHPVHEEPLIKTFIAGAKWADKNPKSPWISVEDKLPDDGVLVIVAYQWILGEILYASDVFHIDYGWEGYEDIVAWMPIPELPESKPEIQ